MGGSHQLGEGIVPAPTIGVNSFSIVLGVDVLPFPECQDILFWEVLWIVRGGCAMRAATMKWLREVRISVSPG